MANQAVTPVIHAPRTSTAPRRGITHLGHRLRSWPPAAWLALLAGLGLLVALATAAPPAVTYRSNVVLGTPVKIPVKTETCVMLPALPAETRAVRFTRVPGKPVPTGVSLQPNSATAIFLGPPVLVDGGTRVIYRMPEVRKTTAAPKICLIATKPGTQLLGNGVVGADLLGADRGSWLDAAPLLAERAAFGRAIVGPAALPLAVLMILAGWVLVVRTAPRGVGTVVDRRAIRSVAMVAALFGCAYAITTPALETPDEMVHLHYVNLLRDRQELPRSTEGGGLSSQLDEMIGSSLVSEVAFQPNHRPPWTQVEDRAMQQRLAAEPTDDARDVFTNASSQPPGYYAVGAVVTAVTGGDVFDRLLVVRLISAFMMAFAVAGALVFARAAVPSAGGLVLVGGLMLATLPLVSFIGGAVNPDAAYTAASAWALASLATMLRHGVTTRRAVWLGVATGAGVLSKLTFFPMLPVIIAGALVIVAREVRAGRARAIARPLLIGAGVAGAVGLPYVAWALLSGRGIVFNPPVAAAPPGGPPAPTTREWLVYTIELYVGQFGPIKDRIIGSGPHIFIDGFVGKLGWLDYGLPERWNKVFEYLWLALTALAGVGVIRAIVRRRSAAIEAALWVLAAVPLMLVISHAGFLVRYTGGVGFEQARYLFPLAPLGVAGVALALRQLPARIHSPSAAVLCVIGVLHGTVLWLVTVGRYFA